MIEDFEEIRNKAIKASTVKIWAEEDGSYKEASNWSLWEESTLDLKQFSDILNYRPKEKQVRKFKVRIDKFRFFN